MKRYDFEIVIPVGIKDLENIKSNLSYILKYIQPQKVVIISSKDVFIRGGGFFKQLEIVEWIDESLMVEGLSIEKIKQIFSNKIGQTNHGNWYFQQFLKMGFSLLDSRYNYYLIWDADTLPLDHIHFFDPITQKPLFTKKTEYHEPYFQTLYKLLEIKKKNDFSYIAEHMMINKHFMRELIYQIEQNKNIEGEKYFEKILNAIEKKHLGGSGFSEFETYGTYVEYHYPNEYLYNSINTFRHGTKWFDRKKMNKSMEKWISKDYPIISFEGWEKHKKVTTIFTNYVVRKCIRFKTLITVIQTIKKKLKR